MNDWWKRVLQQYGQKQQPAPTQTYGQDYDFMSSGRFPPDTKLEPMQLGQDWKGAGAPPPQQPQPQQQFNLSAELGKIGAPPRRPAMPERPQPNASWSNVLASLAAGAADAFGQYSGRGGGNLDRLMALDERQREQQYQDALARSAQEYEDDRATWDWKLMNLKTQHQQAMDAQSLAGAQRQEALQRDQIGWQRAQHRQAQELEQARYAGQEPMRQAQLDALQTETDLTKKMAQMRMAELEGAGGQQQAAILQQLFDRTLPKEPGARAEAIDKMIQSLASKADPNDPTSMNAVNAQLQVLERMKAETQKKQPPGGFWNAAGRALESTEEIPKWLGIDAAPTALEYAWAPGYAYRWWRGGQDEERNRKMMDRYRRMFPQTPNAAP